MTVQPTCLLRLFIHFENSGCGKFLIPWVESTHQKRWAGPKPAPTHYHFTLPNQVTLTAEEGVHSDSTVLSVRRPRPSARTEGEGAGRGDSG